MAYISQEMKKEISSRIKKEFPGWSIRLSVLHHTKLIVKIVKADLNLLEVAKKNILDNAAMDSFYRKEFKNGDEVYGNMERYFGGSTEETKRMKQFMDCVNLVGHPQFANFDNSDSMSDYFHVGYYTGVKIGGETPSTQFEYKPGKKK